MFLPTILISMLLLFTLPIPIGSTITETMGSFERILKGKLDDFDNKTKSYPGEWAKLQQLPQYAYWWPMKVQELQTTFGQVKETLLALEEKAKTRGYINIIGKTQI